MSKSWFLVAYDIRDPVRLRKTATLMKGYGTRMQYSVFRCFLNEREVEKLRWEASKIMLSEDDLQIIGLCKACVSRVKNRSGQDAWPDDPVTFEII